jgi:hypothetical protein
MPAANRGGTGRRRSVSPAAETSRRNGAFSEETRNVPARVSARPSPSKFSPSSPARRIAERDTALTGPSRVTRSSSSKIRADVAFSLSTSA